MRVHLEILPPCMQHAKKTDLGSKMFIIGGNLKQGRRTAMKQEIVDNLLVVEGQPAQLMGNGEDHMDIFDGRSSARRPSSHRSRAFTWHFGQCLERHELKEVASFPHCPHRSRCPPRAAVRHRSMATSTRMCIHVSQDPFFSMKLRPQARIISATSKGGRFIACVASESALAGPSR